MDLSIILLTASSLWVVTFVIPLSMSSDALVDAEAADLILLGGGEEEKKLSVLLELLFHQPFGSFLILPLSLIRLYSNWYMPQGYNQSNKA